LKISSNLLAVEKQVSKKLIFQVYHQTDQVALRTIPIGIPTMYNRK